MKTPTLALVVTSLFACACGNPPPPAPTDAAATDALTVLDTAMQSDTAVNPDLSRRLAQGVTVQGIAVFQGVRIAVMNAGSWVPSASRNAGVVAGRPGVVRVYVDGAQGRALTAQLRLEDDSRVRVIEDTQTITGASQDGTPGSFFEFAFDAADISVNTSLSVRVLDPGAASVALGTRNTAWFPNDGTVTPLEVLSDGGGLNLVLVPLRYDTDGSGRLPDTSAAQLEITRALIGALYPVSNVRITVHAPVPWTRGLTLAGNVNFSAVNTALQSVRQSDNAPDDAYYYGIVMPTTTWAAYCGRSCTTGQSYVVNDATDADFRVGSGVWFTGEDTVWTLAHEVGHQHGRQHAPCDVSSSDANYPYANAALGVLGYDRRTGTFMLDGHTDFMGYCEPNWTSDYTYSAMLDRTRAVNGLAIRPAREREPSTMLYVHADRTLEWGDDVSLTPARSGSLARVRWLDRDDRVIGQVHARAMPVSHGDAQVIIAPRAPSTARVAVWLDANDRELGRASR